MTDKTGFLATHGWTGATSNPITGDASRRSYERLRTADGRRAVLMIAPPGSGEDVAPFIRVAQHLQSIGLGAPRILAEDRTSGFLLLEDFGDDLFARVCVRAPEMERTLYRAATDILIDLHTAPLPKNAVDYGLDALVEAAMLSAQWYAPPDTNGAEFSRHIRDSIATLDGLTDVLALRDYHAENLIWLPDRPDIHCVGLLDFQDAMAGHAAYDLVSLLQDARRDVSFAVAAETKKHFLEQTGRDAAAFDLAYATLGAQRNLRILGVFARLCLRDAKPSYLGLIPRVWAHLQADLSHPRLAKLGAEVNARLPAPTKTVLARLEARCGQMRQ